MEEIDIYLHNHVIWKKNMPNQNFKGVYTWIFTKVRQTWGWLWAEGDHAGLTNDAWNGGQWPVLLRKLTRD